MSDMSVTFRAYRAARGDFHTAVAQFEEAVTLAPVANVAQARRALEHATERYQAAARDHRAMVVAYDQRPVTTDDDPRIPPALRRESRGL